MFPAHPFFTDLPAAYRTTEIYTFQVAANLINLMSGMTRSD